MLTKNAKCIGYQDIFFDKSFAKEAKDLCSKCELKAECLKNAVASNESFGVWGGVNFGNRRELARFLKVYKNEEH